jgi:RNA polymerase sigma-70 factor, ECF subfamily
MDRADDALLAALHEGDEGALSTLLSRHAPAVYRFGMKMCRDPEDAKDVLQDTLLAAARGLRDFRGASSLSTWLYSVARSFCIKKRRRSKHAPDETVSLDQDAVGQDAISPAIAPDEAAAGRELGVALDAAIAALDPIYREVLILRDVEGLTAPEVAEVLDVTVDTVKSRLHRARADVKAKLAPIFPTEAAVVKPSSAGGCPAVVGLFSRYLEGEIGPVECQAMQLHVDSCSSCSAACESLRRTVALCRTAGREKLPADIERRVRHALEAVVRGAPPGGVG